MALAFCAWRFGAYAVLWGGVSLAAALLLACLLLLYVPLTVRVAGAFDSDLPADRPPAVDVSARYLFGALRFDLRKPLPGEGRMTLRLFGFTVLNEGIA